jgi:hypothetical protein
LELSKVEQRYDAGLGCAKRDSKLAVEAVAATAACAVL